MNFWTQSQAIDLCVKLEAIAPAYGFHVALTGGTLYKATEGPRKDIDIILYRIRQMRGQDPELDLQGFLTAIESIGIQRSKEFGWCRKCIYNHTQAIDFLLPELEGPAEDY